MVHSRPNAGSDFALESLHTSDVGTTDWADGLSTRLFQRGAQSAGILSPGVSAARQLCAGAREPARLAARWYRGMRDWTKVLMRWNRSIQRLYREPLPCSGTRRAPAALERQP